MIDKDALSIKIDEEADAAYITFTSKSIVSTVQVTPNVLADLDEAGEIVGIEILPVENYL